MGKISREDIKVLAKESGIAQYSAKMVLKGKWTLEYAKSLERPEFNLGVSWLLQAKSRHWPMAFRTFDLGVFSGQIRKVRKYNVLLEMRNSRMRYVEKIDTAYVYGVKFRHELAHFVKEGEAGPKPAYKPSEREMADLSAVVAGRSARLHLLTGETADGVIRWVTPFDFEFRLDRYFSLLVFKHAVASAEEIDFYRFQTPPMEKPHGLNGFRHSRPFPARAPFKPSSSSDVT